jgi:long-chain acyl-CoA synthetase
MTELTGLDRLFHLMGTRSEAAAIIDDARITSYGDLLHAVARASQRIEEDQVMPGELIGLQADYSVAAIALMLALMRRKCVVALISPHQRDADGLLLQCRANGLYRVEPGADAAFKRCGPRALQAHPLLDRLRGQGSAGFVVFSSGSSGRPKAVLHDLDRFLGSYQRAKKACVTLAFLLLDHIAGLDTLFYTLHAGGTLVLARDRNPQPICGLIDRWKVEVLPVSPSFLKLLCLVEVPAELDLRSLRIITFGSEPMDAGTLARIAARFPDAELRQKYGASEFGAPGARTREGDGLWIRLDSAEVKVRVRDGILWLHAPTTMLGYLNADTPALEDGWYCTGDRVEVDGDWLRILGRESDMINVGGEKVFPSEVEGVIRELDRVAEVAVSGAPHPILGQVVTARVRPMRGDLDEASLRTLVRSHCLRRLGRGKVPVRIDFTGDSLVNERQKTVRR